MQLKRKTAFVGDSGHIGRVYGRGRLERVAELTDLVPGVIRAADLALGTDVLEDVEVIFSTWGMPMITSERLEQLPNLKVVFYAAGSVQHFARPLLNRGITVVSAWQANAVPVAEFALAQVLLSMKRYWQNARECVSPLGWREASSGPGAFGETVAILGSGAVGRALINLLKRFDLDIVVFDPFLADEQAVEMGVARVSLAEAFARGFVVSNHLADKPETVKMIGLDHFTRMRDGATFINTGRGATVDEAALAAVFRDRPSLTALLDVTYPEPPEAGSPLYELPNVHLSSHIAGAVGDEVIRMADFCIEQFVAWDAGNVPKGSVSLDMLETMA